MTVLNRIQKVFTKNQRFTRVVFIALEKRPETLPLWQVPLALVYQRDTPAKQVETNFRDFS